MDSEESNALASGMKANFCKKVSKKRQKISNSSESTSTTDSEENVKHNKKKIRVRSRPKKRIHTTKHKKKHRNRSTSSDSSTSEDPSLSSSSEVSSSTTEEEENEEKVREPASRLISGEKDDAAEDDPSNDIPIELMGEGFSMAPMTKEEWEKKQSVIRRVYDESTGRNRLIKGDGEVLEEIVSKYRHKKINKQATKGDGDYFQKQLKRL